MHPPKSPLLRPSALAPLALVAFTACGGAPEGDAEPQVQEGARTHLLRFTIDGQVFDAEGGPWGPEVSMGARTMEVNFGIGLDPNEYMGEDRLNLWLLAKEPEEGKLNLIRHGTGVDQLPDGAAAIELMVTTHPEFEKFRSTEGTLEVTHVRSSMDGKRFKLTELDGNFVGRFAAPGSEDTHDITGEFRYRK